MRFVLEAPIGGTSSAAVLTAATARALRRAGATVDRVPPDGGRSALPEPCDVWLSAGWPPRRVRPDRAGRWIVRLDWEWGALPRALAPLLDGPDALVVHSEHVAATVRRGGRTAGVHVVPHGVERAFAARGPVDERVRAFADGRPVLLFVGDPIWRKGVDLLVRALLDPRLRGPIVVVAKVPPASSHPGYELTELFPRAGRVRPDLDVLVVDSDLEVEALAALYRAADLLVHPFRAEGFGLPLLEARACGLPVVATGAVAAGSCGADAVLGVGDVSRAGVVGGPDAGVVRVPAVRRDVELPEPTFGTPWVLEPDLDALVERLGAAIRDRHALRRAAHDAASRVAERFTWDRAAAALLDLATCPLAPSRRRRQPTAS